MYKVRLSNKVIKQLDKFQKDLYLRLYNRMMSLSSNPRPNGCIKLTDSDDYRIRSGEYRILYTIIDKESIIEIFDILHRKDAYKKK
jgi:mRNA interferase RelE/StbE